MANLRIKATKVFDSVTIRARFTERLTSTINTGNVSITSLTAGVPDPAVQTVTVLKDVLTIKTRPLTPYAAYQVTFSSTQSSPFKSINGNFLFEDGRTNAPTVYGFEDPNDPIRTTLIGYQKDNPALGLEHGSLARDIINSQASNLSQALHDIRQLKNDNYLSVTIDNEIKTRGDGPFDRLNEEGAYQIIRVGKKIAGSTIDTSYSFSSLPASPITLEVIPITNEKLEAGSESSNFNGLVLTASRRFVTKLKAVRIAYQNGFSATYDVTQYGYQILNDRYDQDYSSKYLILTDNQFKLSDVILETDFVVPVPGDIIYIDYEYQNKGRVVDEDSVLVSKVLDATREACPPIKTDFTLSFFPIVTENDIVATSGGISFLDPNSNPPFSATHPAFQKELVFSFDSLPSQPGEYTVDYSTGRVIVYGETTNDGTGDYPPVATYHYRKTFISRLDYTYDPDLQEVVASPTRDIIGESVKISFSYEDVLVPGVDYQAQIHQEVLDERIENRLVASNILLVKNTPATNVFRIYNETSGEVYKITRWNNNKVYFSFLNPPSILDKKRERVTFASVNNEILVSDLELTNALSVRVLRIPLLSDNIVSASEDSLGSSFNTSVVFSRTDIFQQEIYFDSQELTVNQNTNRLALGLYCIDYRNGLIYIGVPVAQTYDLGSVNYKKSSIVPENSHILSVDEIYYSQNNSSVYKRLDYSNFTEGEVIPTILDFSDERFLNKDTTLPYVFSDGTISVSDDVKEVRGVYDVFDLNNNTTPINFGEAATVAGPIITLNPDGVFKEEVLLVGSGGIINTDNISPGAELYSVSSVLRVSDSQELWSTTPGTISGYQITLNAGSGYVAGDEVRVIYHLGLNGASTPVVDYNRGDYFIDYSYLADEILVSYEYGDNQLDFRESGSLNQGETYYVTYKVGALRDALLKNFGTLVNLPILNTFDTSLPRENYRDALTAALQSFTKGPTLPSMKAIVSNITHIDPEIEEAAFTNWSLGISRLYPGAVNYDDSIQLISGKYNYGALIDSPDQYISFPVSSNLRLEEGTLELWVLPQWDGLDNDANLTFSIKKDGVVLGADNIYIGSDSHNPSVDSDGKFTVNRTDDSSPIGLPSAIYTSLTGFFIYYDVDNKLWKVYSKDKLSENHVYSGTIESSGEFYNSKFLPGLGEVNDVLRTRNSKIEFEFNLDGYDVLSPDGYTDGYSADGYYPLDGYTAGYSYDGISFMSDEEHYLFDFGKTESTNRFSLFKDGKGYLNFRVYDRGRGKERRPYAVSSDISGWTAGEKHHVAVSWRLNSKDRRDEMHLFIDGEETPNIMKFGGRPQGASTDRFRTVKPEYVAGTVAKKAIAGNDLNVTLGSNIVTSDSINFQNEGIVAGDTLTVLESGFSTYTVVSVSTFSMVLDSVMPGTLADARFSVNQYSVVVSSQIDLYQNIAISVLRGEAEIELPGLRAAIPSYSVGKNSFNENVLTILGNVGVGDRIVIRTLGINHRRCRDIKYLWEDGGSVLRTQMPPPINLDEVRIVSLIQPRIFVNSGTTILAPSTQPSNSTQGRTLNLSVTSGNVNFTTNPVTVQLDGYTQSGAVTEVVTFTTAGSKYSVSKFTSIASITISAIAINPTKTATSLTIEEAYILTYSEGNDDYPVVRYSYRTQSGKFLEGTSGVTTVVDSQGFFVQSNVGQKLVLTSPIGAVGTYEITEWVDKNTIKISPAPPVTFTNGIYSIFNTSLGRSGFQNGFFVFELAGATNIPYQLPAGYYSFDYSSYLEIPMDSVSGVTGYLGCNLNKQKQAKAVLDEFRISNQRLTDVRVGETLADNENSITTNFTALRAGVQDSSTLMLLHLDSLPLVNSADYWVSVEKAYLQSSSSVNDNFGQSLFITNKPLKIDNKGLFTTDKEGSIEFWVSPKYDTYNDPEFRFYFDASGSVVEEVTSLSSGSVMVAGKISSVVSVRLATDLQNSGEDYFQGGSVESDGRTLRLKKVLPGQQTKVKVNYVPSGLSGNRISIYKDREGFITFNIRSVNQDYQIRQPVFWQRDSWHRVTATYKLNSTNNRDEMRLFVDGEERGVILFGSGILFGDQYVFGQGFSSVGDSKLQADINFSDPINEFVIGGDYLGVNTAYARIDNLRLSNIARRPFSVGGQPKDINYSSNIVAVYPVVSDLYTTYLLNFDTLMTKADDFALLRDEKFGIFNFTMNIIDSFGIVSGSAKVKQILESLILALKPAQSKVEINYV